MSDLHIDDFYRDSARILLQLYKQFPRRSMIYTEDIAGVDTVDDFGLPSERHQACFASLLWLADAGYLEYGSTVAYEALDQAVLSHRGFNLLAAIEQQPDHLPTPHQQEQSLALADDEESEPRLVNRDNTPLTRSQLLRYKLKHQSSIKLGDYMRYMLALS